VTREIYAVNNDANPFNLLVFSHEQTGDVSPVRELKVDHGAWGISLDRDHDEMAVSIQHTAQIAIYSRTAQGAAQPLRVIQGPRTELANPHGVFIDTRNQEIVVANHGSWHLVQTGRRYTMEWAESEAGRAIQPLRPSSGRFNSPSITVYPRAGSGDVAPLRVIQGPKTRLDWPAGVAVDPERNEIFVANDGGNSVLVFPRSAHGDVAPIRSIEGPVTGLGSPTSVFVDARHDELWVANWGNYSATVYRREAAGNVAPLRTIRAAPPGTPLPGIGNPGAVGYDAGRDQLLVPN
jgi:DNA-binding beta-propeller fold protein YncE